MSDRIRGRYPGGPHRPEEGEERTRPTHLPSVEEIEVGVAQATRSAERRKRRKRVWMGFVVAMVVAGGVGFGVGRAVRPPQPEEVLPTDARSEINKQISEQVNRVLIEEWRMEDVQYARGRGRTH